MALILDEGSTFKVDLTLEGLMMRDLGTGAEISSLENFVIAKEPVIAGCKNFDFIIDVQDFPESGELLIVGKDRSLMPGGVA